MPCAVERGAQEVVHGRVDDQEAAPVAFLDVLDTGEEHARVADDRATRIDDELLGSAREHAERAIEESGDRLRRLVLVADADAAADIDMPQGNPHPRQVVGQRRHPSCGLGIRGRGDQLRADVAADAYHLDTRHGGRSGVERGRSGVGNAEFVLAEARGNVWMRAGVDVRIDAKGDRRSPAKVARHAVYAFQLAGGLQVDAADTGGERVLYLRP